MASMGAGLKQASAREGVKRMLTICEKQKDGECRHVPNLLANAAANFVSSKHHRMTAAVGIVR